MISSIRNLTLLLLLGCLFWSSAAAEQTSYESVNGCKAVSGRMLIQFERGSDVPAQLRVLGMKRAHAFKLTSAEVWQLPPGLSVARALQIVRQIPGVTTASPDYIRTISQLPNDPKFTSQYAPERMSLPLAWDVTTGSRDVVVAVIDTGVQYDHPDLQENIYTNANEIIDGIDNDGNGYIDDVHGWDFIGSGTLSFPHPDNDPTDYFGHGTKVAGIIGAVGNNAEGVAGVAWNVHIMPLKIGTDSANSEGSQLSITASIEAIEYATLMGADVINASYGTPPPDLDSGESKELHYNHFEMIALQAAQEQGVIFVCAAGNDGINTDERPVYPGYYNLANVITVAATVSSDYIASYSNYGEHTVDISAPGSAIYTTSTSNSYGSAYGTSFASPQIAGTVSLLRAKFPQLNPFKVRTMLLDGSNFVTSHTGKTVSEGIVNAYGALTECTPWSLRRSVSDKTNIPDNDPVGISSTINIPNYIVAKSVAVTAEVNHPWMGDIALALESPSGKQCVLKEANYDANRGFKFTFDTQGVFENEMSQGDWTLHVTDNGPSDRGFFLGWSIEIIYDGPTGDVNLDGAVNIVDLINVRNELNMSIGRADANGDGKINIIDLIVVRNQLGLTEE